MRYLIVINCFSCLAYVLTIVTGFQQETHRLWPSLRDPAPFVTTNSSIIKEGNNDTIGDNDKDSNSTGTTLVYGSPICIGRCFIFQIFWSNSSSSVLSFKLTPPPTFPRPNQQEINRKFRKI